MALWRIAKARLDLIVLSLVSLLYPAYLLAKLPPIWYTCDTSVMIGLRAWIAIPHYPPLYPIFARLINYYALACTPGGSPVPIEEGGNVNELGLYAIVVVQHLLAAAALLAFVTAAARTFPRRLFVLGIFLLNPLYFWMSHSLQTEGLWLTFILLQCAFALRIWRSGAPSPWLYLGYFLAFFCGVMTRYPGAVLGALLPGMFLVSFLLRRPSRGDVLRLGGTVLATAGLIVACGFANRICCKKLHCSLTPVWARPAVYRISTMAWENYPPETTRGLIRSIQERTADPRVKKAVVLAFANKNAWCGIHDDIREMIGRETGATDWVALSERTDEVLSEVCRLYLTSGNRYVLQGMWRDYVSYATEDVTFPLIDLALEYCRDSYATYHHEYSEVVLGVRFFSPGQNDDVLQRCDAFADSLVFRLWSKAGPDTELFLLVWVVFLALVGGWCRFVDAKIAVFSVSLVIVLQVYYVLISVMTLYLIRYACVGPLLTFASLGAVVGNWDYRATVRGLQGIWSRATGGPRPGAPAAVQKMAA
jgi:hypothetical protein